MAKALIKQHLTKPTCKAARTTGVRYVIWDTELSNFAMRVSAIGAKVFIIRYWMRDEARERLHTFANYGRTTPEEARAEAKRLLGGVDHGIDPQGNRAKARADLTIAQLCDEYLKHGCAAKKSSTIATDKTRIERHIKPLLGGIKVAALKRSDCQRFVADVARGKTAVAVKPTRAELIAKGVTGAELDAQARKRTDPCARGGKGTATRTMRLLGGIMSFAIDQGMRTDNPTTGVKTAKDKEIHRPASVEEIARLTEVWEAMEAEGVHPFAFAIIRLLLFTGARSEDIAALRWSEVDLTRRALHVADGKEGARDYNLHPDAVTILDAQARGAASDYVFPATRGKRHYVGFKKVWLTMRARADVADMRIHDLRHTVGTLAAGAGLSDRQLAQLLGHKDIRTSRRYTEQFADDNRRNSDLIGGRIAAAMTPPPAPPPDDPTNVVSPPQWRAIK